MAGAMIYLLLYNNWLFWVGFGVLFCSASELGTLRSLNASAKQSTTFKDGSLQWKASWAVDGSNRTDSGKCQCCSATVFQTNPWLQIDLGRYYRLGSYEVFARSDGKENVWGMDVFFTNGGNWSDNYEANITLPTNNSDVRYFNTTLADPVIARYVTMVLPRYDLLVVCEVNIYSKDCQAGTYGLYCNETCGRCQGSDICDSVFGNCSFCEPGYIGTYCKTECPERNFGQNCSSLCHCHGNQTCNRVNGSCPGDRCDLGWRGSNCSNECDPGTYGENCLQMCGHCHLNETCDRRTGNCTLCSSGYTGTKCDAECQNKKYGFNCSMTCGNCQGPCEVSSGTCNTPCQPGYTGPFCNETCAHDTYGQNCSMACGMCANNKTCDIFNGYCVACAENYNGPMCVTGSETPHSDDSTVTLIAVGVVAGFVISIVLVVVLILVLRRRSKDQSESKDVSFDAIKRVLRRNEPQKGSSIDDNDAMNAKVTLDRRSEEILAPEEVDQPVGDMHDYYSFEPKKISVTQLWDYINDIIEKENDTFGDEFELLGKCPIHLATIGNAEINLRKNKYKDIRAYDHTRVILQREDLEKTDYINANYILGYDKKVKFIASQGPTQAMLTDFLLMIIQQKCSIVVMLTNVFELGVLKCLQYWPEEGKSITFEDIVVTTQSVDVHTDYDIRLLELKWNGSSHVVKQFHFRSWPDKNVPESVWCLVNFWRAVDSTAALVTTPVLVHCSAGIGRTGTFIALDTMYYQAKATGCVSPFDVVRQLREQRIKMVQTKGQYEYLHKAVAEALLVGTETLQGSKFDDLYTFMNQPDAKLGSKYAIQFKLIEDGARYVPNAPPVTDQETEYTNVASTALLDEPPQEEFFIPIVTGPRMCILMPPPKPDEIERYWRRVYRQRITSIVIVAQSQQELENESYGLDKNGQRAHDDLLVQRETNKDKIGPTTLKISNTKKNSTEPLMVKQFHLILMSEWPDKSCVNASPDHQTMAAKLGTVVDWAVANTLSSSILLICSDGNSTSGFVAVILNELLRMKLHDGAFNIMESVKTMKAVDKNIVTSATQLQFCYDAIWAYRHQDDVYQNV